MARDFMIVAAEYKQSLLTVQEAMKSIEQAQSTLELMQCRLGTAEFKSKRLAEELAESALASLVK